MNPAQPIKRLITALIVALIAAALLPAGGCRKTAGLGFLRIGLPEEPKSLNLFLASDANSRKILSLIYQPLYHRHPQTLEIIPWLAQDDPVFDEAALTYKVTLREARWSDGTAFTSEDVLFTQKLITDFKIPRYYSQWQVVAKAEALNSHTVLFYLKEPSAIFMSRVMTAPIVSKKEWEAVAADALTHKNPIITLQNHAVIKPLGTGPFMLREHKKGSYIHMKRNPFFFGTGLEMGMNRLGPYVDDILFKIYGTNDVAILALKKKDIDFYWWDIQPGYIEDLQQTPAIDLFFNKKSALYYMGFNVRKAPFNDRVLRQAVATVVDKEFILKRILQNHGTIKHSIVPSANHFWHNPNVARYGYGLDHDQRMQSAWKMLTAAGYSWEIPPVSDDGRRVTPSGIILPSGARMERFTILTPPADYDPRRAFAGIMIQEWLRELGLPAFARPMSFNALLETVKGKHDYDMFILGYGQLDLDPEYLATFFTSENARPRGWNMCGYHNSEYDRLAETQRVTVDPEKRRQIIWKMQEMLLEDVPYLPLYNPYVIEAVMNERFTGWVEKVDGIGNIWSMTMVRPVAGLPKK